MSTDLIQGCRPEALSAFLALSPTERGKAIDLWYRSHQPSTSKRYVRQRYHLETFKALIDELEAHVLDYGFTAPLEQGGNRMSNPGGPMMAKLATVEGALTDAQTLDSRYEPLKKRFDALQQKCTVEYELLAIRQTRPNFSQVSPASEPQAPHSICVDRRGRRAEVLYRGEGVTGQRTVLARIYDLGEETSGQLWSGAEHVFDQSWQAAPHEF